MLLNSNSGDAAHRLLPPRLLARLASAGVAADDFPNRTVEFIVPYAAGGWTTWLACWPKGQRRPGRYCG